MNTLPTYTEQFNKITEAYIKGEIKPWNINFCFCGTLAKGSKWLNNTDVYSSSEYERMERGLFSTLIGVRYIKMSRVETYNSCGMRIDNDEEKYKIQFPNYEDQLFSGMVAALEVLKQIHIERGEVIDNAPVFTKRFIKQLV